MSEWPVVPIANLAVDKGLVGGPFGSSLVSADYTPNGIPVIRGVNVSTNGRFNPRDFVFVSAEKVERDLIRNLALPGDVIFTQRGTLGQVGVVPDGLYDRYVVSQSQMRLRVDRERAIPEFVYYAFRSREVIDAIHNHAITTGVPHINLSILGTLPIRVPPLKVQGTIVDLLGALDERIAINERVSLTALELGSATYDAASRSPTWIDVTLALAAKWYSGGTPNTTEPTFWNGDIPWISAASLKSPWLDESDRRVTALGAASGTRIAPKGSVIFVVRGMSLKAEFRVGLAQRNVAFGQDCKALVPLNGIGGDLLFHAIRNRTTDVLAVVDEAGHGTGRLATDRIERMVVRVPSTPSDRINGMLRSLNDLAASRQRESRALGEMRDLLLPKLMSGEIRVRDAEKAVKEVVS